MGNSESFLTFFFQVFYRNFSRIFRRIFFLNFLDNFPEFFIFFEIFLHNFSRFFNGLFTFFTDKRQTPCENVHEVGQPIRVRTTVELSDVHDIVFVLQHSSLVVVHIQIIGRRKNGNQWGETCRLTFSVHAIPGKKEGSTSSNQILIVYLFLDRLTQRLVLHELELWIISYFAVENHSWLHNCNKKLYFYMNPDQIILDFFRFILWFLIPVKVWAPPDRIMREMFCVLLAAKILQRIWPQEVTHGTKGRWFLEAIQLKQVNEHWQ